MFRQNHQSGRRKNCGGNKKKNQKGTLRFATGNVTFSNYVAACLSTCFGNLAPNAMPVCPELQYEKVESEYLVLLRMASVTQTDLETDKTRSVSVL